MTEDKAGKTAIRARMAKTGESYTAAGRHVVKSKAKPGPRQDVDLGKSDETIKRGSARPGMSGSRSSMHGVRRGAPTARSRAT
jgi:hypothetical protein